MTSLSPCTVCGAPGLPSLDDTLCYLCRYWAEDAYFASRRAFYGQTPPVG